MKTKLLTTYDIIEAVASITGKPAKVLRGASKVASVVAARNLCYKIAKEQLYLSDKEIAKSFSRDRSSVTYSLRKVEKDIEERPNYRLAYKLIQQKLGI